MFKTIFLLVLISYVSSEAIYDTVKSYVTVYNQKNFDSQVTNNRHKGISIVHFYKDDDGASKAFAGQFELFGRDNKGMFRIGSLDCKEFTHLCAKEKVDKFPLIRIYPQFPAPTEDYEGEQLSIDKIKKMASKFIQSRAIEITDANIDTFLAENPGTPKVLLFTDKKSGTPLIYKALSSHFDKTLLFGLIRSTESGLVSKYKVKEFPTVLLIKSADQKPQKYDGKEFTYQELFNFINIYSETFVHHAKTDEVKSSASKPWLSEKVPQLNSDSANDICLKKEGALCVIYIVKSQNDINQKDIDTLNSIGQSFSSKIERGINFNFMWLSQEEEKDFAKIFGFKDEDLPKIVILNPGKRKRFLAHDKGISDDEIRKTLDKILGGDARFNNIKEGLPNLVGTYPQK